MHSLLLLEGTGAKSRDQSSYWKGVVGHSHYGYILGPDPTLKDLKVDNEGW